MSITDPIPPLAAADFAPFRSRLEALYTEIDRAYENVASRYGFSCTGCAENCCLTRFHHHTLVEFFYLRQGFGQMADGRRQEAVARAEAVLAEYEAADKAGRRSRIMCPLNVEQRCLLYRRRPMICRMHGISHVLCAAGRPPAFGPGCEQFTASCGHRSDAVFDRTPFYRAMASLETEMRKTAGFAGKIKLTVADMIRRFCEEDA